MADGLSEPVDNSVGSSFGWDGVESGTSRGQAAPEIDEDFSRFFREHLRKVRGFLGRRGLAPEAVDDLVQDTFLRAYKSFDRLEGRGVVEVESAWIRKIALHLFYNRHRANEPTLSLEGLESAPGVAFDPPDSSAQQADEQVIEQQYLDEIPAVLAEMPPGQQEVLRCWLAGKTYEEICLATSKNLQNVRATLHRAKEKLAERIRSIDEPRGGRSR